MAYSFLKDLLSFPRYSSFFFKIDDVTNGLSKNINHKLNEEYLWKNNFDTSNVRQVRCKVTHPMMLPWQQSRLQALFGKNQISPFFTRLPCVYSPADHK